MTHTTTDVAEPSKQIYDGESLSARRMPRRILLRTWKSLVLLLKDRDETVKVPQLRQSFIATTAAGKLIFNIT
jgi:hypothetical protein